MERERIIRALKICDFNDEGVACKKCPIKDDGFNGAWSDEDGSCYQHLMREAAELLSEQPDTTSDLISRQAAISALCEECRKECNNEPCELDPCGEVEAIERVPSAQPEQKVGRWILYDKRFPWMQDYKCSECGNYLDFSGVNAGRGSANYCPNCGAKMKGELDEQ